MRKSQTILVALFVLALLAAGCSGGNTQTTVSTETPAAPAPAAAPSPTLVAVAVPALASTAEPTPTTPPTATPTPDPLSIASLRARDYPGSDLTIEQTLAPGANYKRYIASYRSDGLKIYGLLTIPNTPKPKSGYPIIIFNHGYIPPAQYKTTERYVNYVDGFARNGYIVFKSDYRGHGNSEGDAQGGYGNADYTIDVLNALSSVKRLPDADPTRIGMWGHSMGGMVTLRAMVVSKEIKAGVIWSGVVASYPDLFAHWRTTATPVTVPESSRHWRQDLVSRYGTPEQNPQFWASISPNSYLKDISGPLQIQHSMTDPEVPYQFAVTLDNQMVAAGKPVEFYSYKSDDHNLSNNFTLAMQRSVAFFDRYVKP